MKVLNVRNVCEALPAGLAHLLEHGRWEQTRAGRALVAPTPVATVYARPRERVLFSAVRDANPFFHLAESVLWMLAGRRDAKFLDNFVGDFGKRFAEDDGTIHDAYGYRWRHAFGFCQLDAVVRQLCADPGSRQAVVQMWDARCEQGLDGDDFEIDVGENDLTGGWKTRPCNVAVLLRIRDESGGEDPGVGGKPYLVLDITVCCRSNDLVWGLAGANAVQFSVLQEYLAAQLDVGVGTYTQVSNNFHMYEDQCKKLVATTDSGDTPRSGLLDDRYSTQGLVLLPLVHDAESFDEEVVELLRLYEGLLGTRLTSDAMAHSQVSAFQNKFLSETVWPALMAHLWRRGDWTGWAEKIAAPDWRAACTEWLQRRTVRAREKHGRGVSA